LACLFTSCCAKDNPKINIKVKVDSIAIKKLPEDLRKTPLEIMNEYAGWEIDSVKTLENNKEGLRFLINGKGKENIEKRNMGTQIVEPKPNSDNQIWSYIVLGDMQKEKPFEFEVLYFPQATAIVAYSPVKDSLKKYNDKTDIILMTKPDMKLRMINFFENTIFTIPMATGKNPGNKKQSGDKKTPEGIFTVYAIHDASDWDYDFKDGKGRIKGTYGKHFIRFKENYHIGIHGTHLPETVGLRATEGCIRLTNENIDSIVTMVARQKTLMIVTPAMEDYKVDN